MTTLSKGYQKNSKIYKVKKDLIVMCTSQDDSLEIEFSVFYPAGMVCNSVKLENI